MACWPVDKADLRISVKVFLRELQSRGGGESVLFSGTGLLSYQSELAGISASGTNKSYLLHHLITVIEAG